MTRDELTGRYYLLTETLLPQDARQQHWVITEPQAFQRVLLDCMFDGVWENYLDRKKVVIDQLDDSQLQHLVSLAEYLLAGGAARAEEFNRSSLEWRGKLQA